MGINKKVIFIDWGGVLSGSMYWNHWQNGTEEEKELYSNINKCFFKYKNKITKWMLGKISAEEICKFFSKKIDVDEKILYDNLVKSCSSMELVSPEIPRMVQEIRNSGKKAVVATDNMDVFSRFVVPSFKFDEMFDDIINSSDVGYFKGDIRDRKLPFFEQYLNENGYKYTVCVLIDDGIDKENVCARVGLEYWKVEGEKDLVFYLNKILDNTLSH